ncbi:hypothetical protein [Psychromonas antarctica]|jgi:hypothetical protein|uniref:hypothetical protein n=1 Tax=Psychromonas antarctica TaxID=67573 RepID=UPI001EE9933F|nr:hypothetical protein [Psychromonas antarctica]MCG6201593.1 hypothetical protein [Psychromonas antarctica]
MSERELPKKWQQSAKVVKAVQIAFDMDTKLQYSIRRSALDKEISPSEQIRYLLDLPTHKKPKRPRLTVSLSDDDYRRLGERYNISADQQLEIKKSVIEELTKFALKGESNK